MPIHPTAIVAPTAHIDPTATVGPYCVVGPDVQIGPETTLLSHVVVDQRTTLGRGNIIHPFASIGGTPQDLKFRGEPGTLVIGDHNRIREGATLHIGTEHGGLVTHIGNRCLLMAYSHVAHDCHLGDEVILANSVGLAGHVHIGDRAILGGMVGVHQFCEIGRHAFIGAGAMVAQNVPPFCSAQGDRAQLVGINVVGLRRAGWSRDALQTAREAFRGLFLTAEVRSVALERVERELAPLHPAVAELCAFVRNSERGVCAPRTPNGHDAIDD